MFTFKFAFWNVKRLGKGSPDGRIEGIKNWVLLNRPDVLSFCEIYAEAVKTFEEQIGTTRNYVQYEFTGFVNTLDKNGKPSGLCLAVYKKRGGNVEYMTGQVIRIPDGSQNRAGLKCIIGSKNSNVPAWILHANATGNNIEALSAIIKNIQNSNAFGIGDFNYNLTKDKNDFKNNPSVGVYAPNNEFTFNNNALLDFLVTAGKTQLQVAALDTGDPDYALSDHTPIMYQITI